MENRNSEIVVLLFSGQAESVLDMQLTPHPAHDGW